LEHDYLKQLMQLANQIQLFRMPRVVCKESSVV
jgi:hypothetical protein